MAAAELVVDLRRRWAGFDGREASEQRARAPAEAAAVDDAEGLHINSAAGAAPDLSATPSVVRDVDPALERVAACAVSLAFLSDFCARCVKPLEHDGAPLTTGQVVAQLVKPTTSASCNFASLVPAAVGRPTAFASHAFGNPFSLLVSALEEHFMNAVAKDVYIWVDIFAINQHNPGADLHGGRALARTIELVSETLVVLDRTAYPLKRLWCLYEMGSTPPDKLRMLTPGFREAELAATFRAVDVEKADCYDSRDKSHIHEHICARFGSHAAFQQMLRLRLLLKPTSYEADRAALLKRSSDVWRFEQLRAYVDAAGDESRLACIAGGPGEGKSTLTAALCEPALFCRAGDASLSLVHAHHFCKASDVRRQDVGEIIRSLSYQLALRFPVFASTLLVLTPTEVETLSDPRVAWDLLIKKPLQRLRGSRVVLLFDALDEAAGSDGAVSKVLGLLLSLGRIAGGAALSIIVTTRPATGISAALRSRWGSNARDFALATLREGDEQSKLLALLRSKFAKAAFASVDAAYTALFDNAAADVTRLLSILLAAQQPPSMAMLEALGVRGACTSLPGWRVLFQEREHCVNMLHRSLAEWLVDTSRSGKHAVDVAAGHRAWAERLSLQLRPWLEKGNPALAPPKGSYAYAYFLPHLDAAGLANEARDTLMRLPWLQATLRERGLYALLSDVAARKVHGDGTLSLLHRTLRLAAPGLQGTDAAEALPGQLVGRLGGLLDGAAPEVVRLYEAAYNWRGSLAWLRPLKPTLQQPVGAFELSLEGHAGPVTSLVALKDGRVVSGSADKSLRVWDTVTGECERTMEGHTAEVLIVAQLSGGRVASTSHDDTLRVWNPDTGECERILKGAFGGDGLLELPDGRILFASRKGALQIWDAAKGECERTLEGHTDRVTSLGVLVHGRVISGSDDTTLRVWNVGTGECVRTLKGHTGAVTSLAVLASGCVASGSADRTIRVWNAATGRCVCILEGHTEAVTSLAALADSLLVSGSRDNKLRLWSVTAGAPGLLAKFCCRGKEDECVRTLEGHTGAVAALAALNGGRVVSGSGDRTLRVWSAAAAESERALARHSDAVTSLVALADGRVVSGSADKTLRVWSAATGACERVLEGHTQGVVSLVALADTRVVSGSRDSTIRMWDAGSGQCERTLSWHTGRVLFLLALADGTMVSGSHNENTLRVWEASTGLCTCTLEGHAGPVTSVLALADGRVVTGSADCTLRIWNVAKGVCERVLEGHFGSVNLLLMLADGRLMSSGDSTLRVWNLDTGNRDCTILGCSADSLVALANRRVVSRHAATPMSGSNMLRVLDPDTGDVEQLVPDRSEAAIAFMSVPHVEAGARPRAPVIAIGSCLYGPGFARTYVDVEVKDVLLTASASSADRVIAAATAVGAVHLFTVVPATC